MQKNRKYIVYALYKGDKFIAEGTIHELSTQTGLKASTIRFYMSKAYQKRNRVGNCKSLIKVEE